MNTKAFGALATCVATLAVVVCVLAVTVETPMPVEIAMIVGAGLLLLSACVLIGIAIAIGRLSASVSGVAQRHPYCELKLIAEWAGSLRR